MSRRLSIVLPLLLASSVSLAHPSFDAGSGFIQGALHPWSGIDHLLALVAVGIWGSQLGGRARWILAASFLGAMTVGEALGAAGLLLPVVEPMLAVSVLLLGICVATAVRLPVAAAALLASGFALLHGHAHGTEVAANLSGLLFGCGMLVSSAAALALGHSISSWARRRDRVAALRPLGAAIALGGFFLLLV